ncbi:type I restriction enzyme HsdR N-terminal domain-containing protein [Agromyces italicus]|uniref:type I restriction enzyme HsdR N-terminal domain-containing protein n=1 Tax=Agromyces italicus TaxID=279572 RepID=UPI0003B43E36|nr:type I restriction enzyme HsdR N-terminal domain-containing protein [Agromyces italicus]
MEFPDALNALAQKVHNQREAIQTEEATKNAFIMPFISSVLGYDVFDPLEVVPEYTADVGIKRGEKIDYAIMRDGEVQMLVECKTGTNGLKIEHASQLFRYFAVTNARIAVLTNGRLYHFFTDLDAPNRMDEKPFLVLDLLDIDESLVDELRKLSKDSFDLESVISAAGELKYIGELKRAIGEQFRTPSDDWSRLFISQVYDGAITQRVRDQFTPLVKKAAAQFLNDQVNERLKAALRGGTYATEEAPTTVTSQDPSAEDLDRDTEIETTLEELEAYQIVKAIACSDVKPQRVSQRDSKSYFAILLDDNNRKPIARLHFNSKKQKYIGLLDGDKVETKYPIDGLEDIYEFASPIREAVARYK